MHLGSEGPLISISGMISMVRQASKYPATATRPWFRNAVMPQLHYLCCAILAQQASRIPPAPVSHQKRRQDATNANELERKRRKIDGPAGIQKRLSFLGIEIRAVHDGVTVLVGLRGLVGQLCREDNATRCAEVWRVASDKASMPLERPMAILLPSRQSPGYAMWAPPLRPNRAKAIVISSREFEPRFQPATGAIDERERPAKRVGKLLGDGKAKPSATGFAIARSLDAIKWQEC